MNVSLAGVRGLVFGSFQSVVIQIAPAQQPTQQNATGKYHVIDGQKTTADEQKLVFDTSRYDKTRLTPTNKNLHKPYSFVALAGGWRA